MSGHRSQQLNHETLGICGAETALAGRREALINRFQQAEQAQLSCASCNLKRGMRIEESIEVVGLKQSRFELDARRDLRTGHA